ncbi:MAG TPA: 50S ribosomal protein L13 [Bdellovibrionales bacterium]|nr:50S ribosomal protein L13 [Bdellovibrionales bacterium]
MRTWNAAKGESDRQWWIVDASGKNLGRLASEVAQIIRGKHKPEFTPNQDTGDFVVVINAEKVVTTGTKTTEKMYYRHSRFFGSLKSRNYTEQQEHDAAFILEQAVQGMLPKNKLSKSLIGKLKAYRGPNHPHAAQKPQALKLKFLK